MPMKGDFALTSAFDPWVIKVLCKHSSCQHLYGVGKLYTQGLVFTAILWHWEQLQNCPLLNKFCTTEESLFLLFSQMRNYLLYGKCSVRHLNYMNWFIPQSTLEKNLLLSPSYTGVKNFSILKFKCFFERKLYISLYACMYGSEICVFP